jgi:hypothetical protein
MKRIEVPLIILLISISLAVSIWGIIPLAFNYSVTMELLPKISQTNAVLGMRVLCVAFSDVNWREKAEALNGALSRDPDFLGLYPYPDIKLISSILSGSENITNFVPFEYNSGLEALGFIRLKEGEFSVSAPDDPDKPLPVAVSANSPFRVNDIITLHRESGNTQRNIAYGGIKQEAIVTGIFYNDIALPFMPSAYISDFHRERIKRNSFVIIIPENHNLERHLPTENKVFYYALFKSRVDWDRNVDYAAIIGEYGIIDVFELVDSLMFSDEMRIYQSRIENYLIPLVSLILIELVLLTVLLKRLLAAFRR